MKHKRKGGLFSRFTEWLVGTKDPSMEKGLAKHGHNVAGWPSNYDDTPLNGDRYVSGTCCKTVEEYKAALVKNDTTMGGWSG